jgi:hypothetical protein
MTKEALKRVAEKLRRTGASIPAPEVTGTIEGSVVTGLCIALALVEAEIEALAQPEQKPFTYYNPQNDGIRPFCSDGDIPLYTHPPQRTWVGLEKSDMPDGADPLFDDPKFIAGMVYAANKLKEKNT